MLTLKKKDAQWHLKGDIGTIVDYVLMHYDDETETLANFLDQFIITGPFDEVYQAYTQCYQYTLYPLPPRWERDPDETLVSVRLFNDKQQALDICETPDGIHLTVRQTDSSIDFPTDQIIQLIDKLEQFYTQKTQD